MSQWLQMTNRTVLCHQQCKAVGALICRARLSLVVPHGSEVQPGLQPQVWWPRSDPGEGSWQRGEPPVPVQAGQPLGCLQNMGEARMSGNERPGVVHLATRLLVTGSCCQVRDGFRLLALPGAVGRVEADMHNWPWLAQKQASRGEQGQMKHSRAHR